MIPDLRSATTRLRILPLICAVSVVGTACGDPFDPFLTPIPDAQEALLVDFREGDLVDSSAFDMLAGAAVRTDQTSGWDFLFLVDETVGPALLPRSGLLDDDSSSGLQLASVPFATLAEAPEEGYTTEELLPIVEGAVVVLVSRRNPSVSVRCRVFGKLEVLSIEGTPATVTINVVINPNCERRALIEEEEN